MGGMATVAMTTVHRPCVDRGEVLISSTFLLCFYGRCTALCINLTCNLLKGVLDRVVRAVVGFSL